MTTNTAHHTHTHTGSTDVQLSVAPIETMPVTNPADQHQIIPNTGVIKQIDQTVTGKTEGKIRKSSSSVLPKWMSSKRLSSKRMNTVIYFLLNCAALSMFSSWISSLDFYVAWFWFSVAIVIQACLFESFILLTPMKKIFHMI